MFIDPKYVTACLSKIEKSIFKFFLMSQKMLKKCRHVESRQMIDWFLYD